MFWFKMYKTFIDKKYVTYVSNLHPFEVVGRGSDTQIQVGENLNARSRRFNG